MSSTSRIIFVIGILACFAIWFGAMHHAWKTDKMNEFDERQSVERGKAYRAGFIFVIALSAFYLLLNDLLEIHIFSMGDAMISMILGGILAFITRCAGSGALWGFRRGNDVSHLFMAYITTALVVNVLDAARGEFRVFNEDGYVETSIIVSLIMLIAGIYGFYALSVYRKHEDEETAIETGEEKHG